MMKMKKLLVLFLALLFSIYIVSAADSANIVQDSLNISGQQGTTKSGSFTVNNTGNTTLSLSFKSSTLTKGSDTLTINSISNLNNLQNGTSQSVSFGIPIGSNQALGVYTGQINVTNASNGFVFDTLPINVNVTPSFSLSASPSSIFISDVKRNSTLTSTFTITNNGNGNLTNIMPTSNAAAKYNIKFNKTGFNLNKTQSESLSVNITVPVDEPTVNHSIGSILMKSNEFNSSGLIAISINPRGGLIIEDLDVRVFYRDGDTDINQDLSEGQKLDFEDDTRPGSELEFRLNVENIFTSDEDIDIEDITITVTIEEIDDGEDLDEESKEFDLKPGENERVTVFFSIPLEVEEGDYDVLIEIEGDDEEGTTHRIERNLVLVISKERNDVIVSQLTLIPASISCDRNTRLSINILNIGSKEQDNVKVEAINNEIGLNFADDGIDLDIEPFDDGDEYHKTVNVNVGNDAAAGTYPIKANVYLGSGALWNSKTVDLVVQNCGGTAEEETEEVAEEGETVTVGVPGSAEEGEEGVKIPVVEEKITESKEVSVGKPIIAVLAVVGVLAVGLGVFVGMKFVPKK